MSTQSDSEGGGVVPFKSARLYDAGGQVLISGPDKGDVQEALEILVQEDKAELISPPTKVGSLWLAACSHPLRKQVSCTVQREGSTLVVTGPSKEAVTVRALDLMRQGAQLVEFPAETNGKWTVVLDIAGADDTGRFDWSIKAYRR